MLLWTKPGRRSTGYYREVLSSMGKPLSQLLNAGQFEGASAKDSRFLPFAIRREKNEEFKTMIYFPGSNPNPEGRRAEHEVALSSRDPGLNRARTYPRTPSLRAS
jgi:hypothetical protein